MTLILKARLWFDNSTAEDDYKMAREGRTAKVLSGPAEAVRQEKENKHPATPLTHRDRARLWFIPFTNNLFGNSTTSE